MSKKWANVALWINGEKEIIAKFIHDGCAYSYAEAAATRYQKLGKATDIDHVTVDCTNGMVHTFRIECNITEEN